MNNYRTHNCNELNLKNVGETVKLAGWVQTIRNLGGMKFIDLRDEQGITQIVVSAEMELKDVVTECVISVEGKVIERSNKNEKIATGDIEIEAQDIKILGKCKNVLPFEVNSEKAGEAREDLRLEYRFLDDVDTVVNSALIYEIGVLKTYVEPLLFNVPEDDPAYLEALRLINFLRNFLPIPSDDVPKDSVLREFIGGSCFKG